MGAQRDLIRVVFDTNTVVSALVFRGELAWLVDHWCSRESIPLISRATANELLRVLRYPKFGLSEPDVESVAARYLPFAERIEVSEAALLTVSCRDPADRMFLALADTGRADVVVTWDSDLLTMQPVMRFAVETPALYRARYHPRG